MQFKIKHITVGYGETVAKPGIIGTDRFYFEPEVEITGTEELTKEQLEEELGALYEQLHEMVKNKVKAKIQQSKVK